jgi:hypothetical protein
MRRQLRGSLPRGIPSARPRCRWHRGGLSGHEAGFLNDLHRRDGAPPLAEAGGRDADVLLAPRGQAGADAAVDPAGDLAAAHCEREPLRPCSEQGYNHRVALPGLAQPPLLRESLGVPGAPAGGETPGEDEAETPRKAQGRHEHGCGQPPQGTEDAWRCAVPDPPAEPGPSRKARRHPDRRVHQTFKAPQSQPRPRRGTTACGGRSAHLQYLQPRTTQREGR